jgi:hypothetical protein
MTAFFMHSSKSARLQMIQKKQYVDGDSSKIGPQDSCGYIYDYHIQDHFLEVSES